MSLRRAHLRLLVAALALPIALVLLLAAGRLLAALGDEAAATVLDRVALGGGLIWTFDLVALVIVQGLLAAEAGAPSPQDDDALSEFESESQ